ncbi:MAG: efflux RND transporter periplasmic adaptor subunit [Candidatus Omnitrophota bacterium]
MKKPIRIIIPVVAIALIASVSVWYAGRGKDLNHKTLDVSGNIETTGVRLAFRAPGKIRELLTDEGEMVKAGAAVARLEIDELEKIRNEAEASLRSAEFIYERAKDDYGRSENLFQAGAISAQKRDAAKTNADSAQANLDALRATLELAVTRLGFAELTSPIDGFILTKSAEAGEVVPEGATIFTVADLKNIWLTAYVNETDLGKVKLNQDAGIRTDTYPGKTYKGRISFISQEAEFTPKQIQTKEERVKLVYRIKIAVDNADLELKPGMPADAFITAQ